jgi:metal-responsive CopG/Arc/MetJ family transcriptional regulator
MKTAISIPDDVFRRGEKYAKAEKLSRSELYTRAVKRLLDEQPRANLTTAYNAAFDDHDSSADAILHESARSVLEAVEWDES